MKNKTALLDIQNKIDFSKKNFRKFNFLKCSKKQIFSPKLSEKQYINTSNKDIYKQVKKQ